MNEKKHILKYEDYIEPKAHILSSHLGVTSYANSLAEFKLDKIFPRNINFNFNYQNTQPVKMEGISLLKSCSQSKTLSSNDNKLFKELLALKEYQIQSEIKRNRIDNIFNIRSINLLDKPKHQRQQDTTKSKFAKKNSLKHNIYQKDHLKELNLILPQKSNSPENDNRLMICRKNSTVLLKTCQNRLSIPLRLVDSFQNRLEEYHQYLRSQCISHGLHLPLIQNYSRHSIIFYVGKGNNSHLIKDLLKKRWWTIIEEKTKRTTNFIWTQLKDKTYFFKKQRPSTAQKINRSISLSKMAQSNKDIIMSQRMQEIRETQIHNHFQNNEFLGNKKALYYNMKAYYESQGKNVFDYLPLTFHVKRYEDQAWKEFTQYYRQQSNKHKAQNNLMGLWIVKPGQNTNRGNGITIHSDYQTIRQFVQKQIQGVNNPKKTFIIQKYIDKPFLYNKRKFDIRCYMLLVRLNGKIKGYWYSQGYIRTSCFEFQLSQTSNEFIHLTNDAIQVNSEKYGKYQDGNKLSFNNFQKYLKLNFKDTYSLEKDILPRLKSIATDCIQASSHLLGAWNELPSFQIFGLDFMIDQNFKPWLIEINTNPCLETTSSILQKVIPKMVDNAFKLSLDLLFPPPTNWPNSKRHYLANKIGHNLFELVFDEDKKDGHSCAKKPIQMGDIQQASNVYQSKELNHQQCGQIQGD